MLKFQYNAKSEGNLMTEVHVNMQMIRLLGFDAHTQFHSIKYLNLNKLSFFRTNNWMQFYSKLMNFITTTGHKGFYLDKEDLFCVKSNGKRVQEEFY